MYRCDLKQLSFHEGLEFQYKCSHSLKSCPKSVRNRCRLNHTFSLQCNINLGESERTIRVPLMQIFVSYFSKVPLVVTFRFRTRSVNVSPTRYCLHSNSAEIQPLQDWAFVRFVSARTRENV